MLQSCKDQEFAREASVVIAGSEANLDYVMSNEEQAYSIDLAIALEHMSLEAPSLGLGTCGMGVFYQEQVKEF